MFPNTITEHLAEPVIKQVKSLTGEERSVLFFQYCLKASQVWLAKNDNGFIMIDSPQGLLLPVWPHRDLVATWESSALGTVEASCVSVTDFMSLWLPGMENNNTGICIFPMTPEDAGIGMSAADLKASFEEELA
ncbi:DUF2750 domain-containing protein [Alteromonas sp. C1M14]|uniref:DUF2750 domain-containing protein n=1 Tax=Alteromonas sp. C1M14 TaxID=2841567 RepID=UPI001C08FF40|nr:DUF2750 domain-containing protein [Alteromonas sp. C1M14]MBU2978969.1 DUF2750 domain-containing protein [Alteromonas sp. C1M14]